MAKYGLRTNYVCIHVSLDSCIPEYSMVTAHRNIQHVSRRTTATFTLITRCRTYYQCLRSVSNIHVDKQYYSSRMLCQCCDNGSSRLRLLVIRTGRLRHRDSSYVMTGVT